MTTSSSSCSKCSDRTRDSVPCHQPAVGFVRHPHPSCSAHVTSCWVQHRGMGRNTRSCLLHCGHMSGQSCCVVKRNPRTRMERTCHLGQCLAYGSNSSFSTFVRSSSTSGRMESMYFISSTSGLTGLASRRMVCARSSNDHVHHVLSGRGGWMSYRSR